MSVGPQNSTPSDAGGWLDDALWGVGCYYLTSLVVLVGVLFSSDFVKPRSAEIALQTTDLVAACMRFDANSYADIVRGRLRIRPAGAIPSRLFSRLSAGGLRNLSATRV